jgi:hypothetical protein
MLIVYSPGSPSLISFFTRRHFMSCTTRLVAVIEQGKVLYGGRCRNGRKKFPHQGLFSSPTKYRPRSPPRIMLTLSTNGLQQLERRRHLERNSKREDHVAIPGRSTPCNCKSSSSYHSANYVTENLRSDRFRFDNLEEWYLSTVQLDHRFGRRPHPSHV